MSFSEDEEEDRSANSFKDINSVFKFLISNKETNKRYIDKQKLNDTIQFLHNVSLRKGLSREVINNLCTNIIFEDHYDIITRRKLLYSCIPKTDDFPYSIIPLAVSCTSVLETSSAWQLSILHWIAGLLEYQVIDKTHKLLHICYTSLFNHIQNTALTGIVTKILYQITRQDDVTPHRVQTLTRLEKKIGYLDYVPALLRIYKLFRPDLIVFHWERIKSFPSVPKPLKDFLANAKERNMQNLLDAASHEDMWPNFAAGRKRNPFHEHFAVPQPEILVYSDKLEEKKEVKISVLQYRRINDMIKNLDHWKDWQWPNNPAGLLRKPVAISLFKPHDPYIKVAISNWLEIALREEVIGGVGSPIRQEKLLDICITLLKQTETFVPAVFYFLTEFLSKWDKFSHFSKVIEILSFTPFLSPAMFFESAFVNISQLLTTCTVSQISSVIEALSSTAVSWALQSRKELPHYRNAQDYPYCWQNSSPLEGIYFLTKRLERVIIFLLLRNNSMSRILNFFISYYSKVNMVCEELNLPLLVAPSTEFVLSVINNSDPVSIHRLGNLLTNLRGYVIRVRRCKIEESNESIRVVSLSQIENINFTVMIYLDSVVLSQGFCEKWWELLSNFVGRPLANKLTSLPEINLSGSVCRALPLLPLISLYIKESGDYFKDKKMKNDATRYLISKLSEIGFDGIEKSALTFIKEKK